MFKATRDFTLPTTITGSEAGRAIQDKKVAVGVVDHRNLQVERPEQVAALIRKAPKHISLERLILSTDCGFGREGMSRRIAFYKMVSIVRGAPTSCDGSSGCRRPNVARPIPGSPSGKKGRRRRA